MSLLTALLSVACVATTATAQQLTNFNDWAHQRVATDDVSIHLRYHGTGPPLLLVHGAPQHSPTWTFVGPILAQNYTVIAVDLRGMGDSSIPFSYDFTAAAAADDLTAVLDFLQINQTYVFGHDKGTGVVAALAAQSPGRVKRLAVAEYALPGFGYESFQAPTPTWNLYSNWQLAFYSVPDAAQFFTQGRERQMLEWSFFHSSYAGAAAISNDLVTSYADAIARPGFLRAMFQYFANPTVAKDAAFFTAAFNASKLPMPVLSLGGEASIGDVSLQQQLFGPIADDLTADVVPKAGHWIADENPQWLAKRIAKFLADDEGIPSIDLSYLADQVSLQAPII